MTNITRGSRWAALFAFAFFAGILCGSSGTVGLPALSDTRNCIPFGCPPALVQAQDGRAYFGTTTGGNDVGGLVTQFDSVVPEPGSLVLVLTGFGVVGLRLFVRVRRRT
jgi:hypothetical protein